MYRKRLAQLFLTLSLVLGTCFSFSIQLQADNISQEAGPLPFQAQRQLQLGELDQFHRASSVHIQLNTADQPRQMRMARIKANSVGWHNYRFYYSNGSKKA